VGRTSGLAHGRVWDLPISLTVIVHLNGKLVPAEQARIGVFDRGFIFGEGVYEGLRSFRGKIVAMQKHADRMRNGLRECRIDWDPGQMVGLTDALLKANAMPDAFIYWQVTRGAPGPGQPVRSRTPQGPMTPTVFGYCSAQPPIETYTTPPTVTAATRPDTRWHRGHLKSISLLGGVLAAIEAEEAGAADAIMVRDGLVTEGTATNVVLALPGSGGRVELATPSLESASILAGVTRALEVEQGPGVVSRPVREQELRQANEIMLLGSTSMVTSVVELNGKPVGDGKPGPQANRLLRALVEIIRQDLGFERVGTGKPAAAAV
jgi:D-alanine transaminase